MTFSARVALESYELAVKDAMAVENWVAARNWGKENGTWKAIARNLASELRAALARIEYLEALVRKLEKGDNDAE